MEYLPDDFPLEDIAEWLAGTASPDAVGRMDRWAAEAPAHRVLLEVLERTRGLLRASDGATGARDSTGVKARIVAGVLRRVGGGGTQTPPADLPIGALRGRPVSLGMGALPSEASSSGLGVRSLPAGRGPLSLSAVRSLLLSRRWSLATALAVVVGVGIALIAHRTSRVVSSARVYATVTAQRTTMTLVDGSRVVLAPQSRLVVSSDFGDATRSVILVGEAYFDVATRTDAPFVVQSGEVRTRVLGTTFDVRHYDTDHDVRIVVLSGKVQSRRRSRLGVTLTAGMIAHVTDSTVVLLTKDSTAQYVGWINGRLEFHETPLPDVLATLERWYQVRFRLADSSLANIKLTGDLDNFRTTAGALNALEALLSVRMTYDSTADGEIVTLHPQPAGAMPLPTKRDPRHSFITQQEVGR